MKALNHISGRNVGTFVHQKQFTLKFKLDLTVGTKMLTSKYVLSFLKRLCYFRTFSEVLRSWSVQGHSYVQKEPLHFTLFMQRSWMRAGCQISF